jgi:hypothetical protein
MGMAALAITIAFSFIFGCSTFLAERKASRILDKGSPAGAAVYALVLPLGLAVSLAAIALIGTALGTYARTNDGVVLASYIAGFALLLLLDRTTSRRR